MYYILYGTKNTTYINYVSTLLFNGSIYYFFLLSLLLFYGITAVWSGWPVITTLFTITSVTLIIHLYNILYIDLLKLMFIKLYAGVRLCR